MLIWRPGFTLETIERLAIEECFIAHGKNKTQTAAVLGISLRTLDTKLQKYDADAKEKEKNEHVRREKARAELDRARRVPSQFQFQSFVPPMPSSLIPVLQNELPKK